MLRPRKKSVVSNKWTHENVNFDLSELPPQVLQSDGIIPFPMVLDTDVGVESTLLLIDHNPFIYDLAKLQPFTLNLRSGLLNTSHGPVVFHLFIVPEPIRSEEVFAVYEAYANPFEMQHTESWRGLSRQTHWHLILIDSSGEQVGFYEFENNYRLGQTLDQVDSACEGMKQKDFLAAKREIMQRYSLDDLMEM
jgi:hypothetical protein